MRGRGTPTITTIPRGGNPRGGRAKPPTVGRNVSANKHFVNKKFADRAHITSLLTQNKTFALQRLMRDYNEIKNSNFALHGVSALPLESDFFTWHANIKALSDNIYKGCVVHLSIFFTEEYPISPPIIKILNGDVSLKHPNIFGSTICLDMLEISQEKNRGWNSSYTVFSILLQLQNFFFEFEEDYLSKEEKKDISKNVKKNNEFNCTTCPHRGSSNPWPEFIKNENQENSKMNKDKYKDEKKKEFVCYFSKTNWQENPLGLGISIAKVPRTGEIKGIVPRLDYVSLKCFTKQKIRNDISGNKFTHWFPIYFGNKEDQFFHLAKNAISLIETGSTRNFNPNMIFTVLPKFFMALITEINSENIINSSRSLKMLIHIYRIVVFFTEKFPEIYEKFENAISNFIENPCQRHKDNTPSLGDMLIYTMISKKFSFEDLLPAYVGEQMDRQIFWILQAIPELEVLIESSAIDDVRAKVCFKSFMTGAHILLFSFYFTKKIIFKGIKKNEEITKLIDENYGTIPEDQLDAHQKEIQKILKIDNFQDYYKFLNLPILNDEQINQKLKQAYKNSEEKKYHGFDAVRFVPDNITQMQKYFEKFPKLDFLINEKDGKLISENDSIWEKFVLEKFEIANLIKHKNPARKLTPIFILENYEKIRRDNLFTKSAHNFENYKKTPLDKLEDFEFNFKNDSEKILENFTWRKIYLKFYLENLIKHFNNFADFKHFYNFVEIANDEIVHLNVDVETTSNLKSDYNYIRVLFTKLTKLEYVNLNILNSVDSKNQTSETKLTKNLIKGLNNFKSAGGKLLHFKIFMDISNRFTEDKLKTCSIWNILDKLPDLKSLDCNDTVLNKFAVEKIRNHFYYFKSITTLKLTNCDLTDTTIKDLSDGMMKAKGIENIFLNKNKNLKTISGIISNLAFQPGLKILDISENSSIDDFQNLNQALTKMLKMSQSLETLICSNLKALNMSLDLEFYTSLGDNNCLKYLDLSNSGLLNYTNLGISVAMNSLKKGSLEVLKIAGKFTFGNFETFIKSLSISEEIHNKWYGNNINLEILKDTKEYYEKKFYNNLKYLDFSQYNLCTNININDLKNKSENELKTLLEKSQNLQKISFAGCLCNKYFIEMLNNALHQKNNIRILNMRNFLKDDLTKLFTNSFFVKNEKGELVSNKENKLEKLDLSNNDFGYSGIESLSKVLKSNNTIKSLNLYHNLFGVNGARRLSESLKDNKTLEILDIGYNRIRDLGFKNIVESIIENKNSNIKEISFRCNFIRAKIISEMLPLLDKENYNKEKLTKLITCNLSNNLINEISANEIYQILFKENSSLINSDIFSISYFNNPERLERCAWITCIDADISKFSILQHFEVWEKKLFKEENTHMGVILDLKLFKGRRIVNRATKGVMEGNRIFVEFVDPNSVSRLLKIASTEGFLINGRRLKCFKAGAKKEVEIPKKKFNK